MSDGFHLITVHIYIYIYTYTYVYAIGRSICHLQYDPRFIFYRYNDLFAIYHSACSYQWRIFFDYKHNMDDSHQWRIFFVNTTWTIDLTINRWRPTISYSPLPCVGGGGKGQTRNSLEGKIPFFHT